MRVECIQEELQSHIETQHEAYQAVSQQVSRPAEVQPDDAPFRIFSARNCRELPGSLLRVSSIFG